MKSILPGLLFLCLSLSLRAEDLSSRFTEIYKNDRPLNSEQIRDLQDIDFYLVPGILSEAFIKNDRRTILDFSIITKEYFSSQQKLLKERGLKVKRLSASSFSIEETKANIRFALDESSKRGRKTFFITHSLGGLALLEELIENDHTEEVRGIIFIQSPFRGAPVADVYLSYPLNIDKWLNPILPFFNTSIETLQKLSVKNRVEYMKTEEEHIKVLLERIPIMTVAGLTNDYRTLFKPSVDLIEFGCVKTFFSRCLTDKLYEGPYDRSDGMVPVESSKLLDADFIVLKGADHGETVVNVPFRTFNKKRLTEALLKVFLSR